MKKLWIVLVAVAGSVTFASAQEAAQDSAAIQSQTNMTDDQSSEQKAQINADELPDAIKQTLADQEYKGWIINAVYQDRKEETYEVELKNGADTQTVKFNSEGQRLDD
ncbi:MAG TPA: hypothetical protein VKZ68_01120 [Ohtaekwangia sp.]|nr:hypothetical protein [Ohtaekwangia sp.]